MSYPDVQRIILDALSYDQELDIAELVGAVRRVHPEMPTTTIIREVAQLITELAVIPTALVSVRVIRPTEEIPD